MKQLLSDVRLAVRQWSNRLVWIGVILLTLATVAFSADGTKPSKDSGHGSIANKRWS
jgi:hypothetical protein